jgi:hypothetical protein
MPEIKPPTPLPDAKETTEARRRRVAKEGAGSTVASTLLSSGGREKLGAG